MSDNTENAAIGRFGYISDFDAKRMMARVAFPDKNNLVSDWLPVLILNAKLTRDEHYLDVGEHVYCLMQGNGLEAGVILGAVYDDANKPEIGDKDIRSVQFEDGSVIKHNRSTGTLDVYCTGDINITAKGNVKIIGARIDLNP